MIISRTPFRISFFGGGTDYPDWYLHNGGSVLSTAIDKYCYIMARELPPFFEHKYRISYSIVENTKTISEIKHPGVRAALDLFKFNFGLEIHANADLPARAGLGSSSTFLVGLLKALHDIDRRSINKHELALQAIYVEQSLMADAVGSQDQVAAAYGGFNKIIFNPGGLIEVHPIKVSAERLGKLNSHLMLFFTGFSRTASEIARHKINNINERQSELRELRGMVDEGLEILSGDTSLNYFGELLHHAWNVKTRLSEFISNSDIDNIYLQAIKAGAIGGKILGAGGGGFLLLFVPPKFQNEVKTALSNCTYVPFCFEGDGSQIIYRQE